MHKLHFISGLPRSGSTLLSGILNQNPDFHASMSSPVASLVNSSLELTGAGSEFYSFFDEAKRIRISKALINAYYEDVHNPVIFDTNRMWTARLHQLVELYDDFKVICLVRNPAWVMDSFEKIYRKNPFNYSKMFSAQNRATVYWLLTFANTGINFNYQKQTRDMVFVPLELFELIRKNAIYKMCVDRDFFHGTKTLIRRHIFLIGRL